MNEDCIELPDAESLLVHREISTKLLGYGSVLIHGAAIAINDKCFIIIAPSGVGKTTHTLNWLKAVPDAYIANGDKLFIDVRQQVVYGSPWCGKEGYGDNVHTPLAGLIALEKGSRNGLSCISFHEMLPTLPEQCFIPEERNKRIAAYNHIGILSKMPCYRLCCNMDPNSAILAYTALVGSGPSEQVGMPYQWPER